MELSVGVSVSCYYLSYLVLVSGAAIQVNSKHVALVLADVEELSPSYRKILGSQSLTGLCTVGV